VSRLDPAAQDGSGHTAQPGGDEGGVLFVIAAAKVSTGALVDAFSLMSCDRPRGRRSTIRESAIKPVQVR